MVGKKQKALYLYGSWVLFVLAAALEPASSQTGGTGCDNANCTTTVTTTTVTTTTSVTTGTRQDGGSTTTAAPGLPPSSVKAGVLAGALSGTVIVIFALVVMWAFRGRKTRLANAARQVNDLSSTLLPGAELDSFDDGYDDQRDEDMVIFARGSGAGVNNPFPKKFSTGGPGGSATSSLGRVQGLSEGSAGGPGGRATAAANANGGRFSVDVDTSGSSNVTSIYDGSSSNGSGRSRPTVDADGYDVAAIAAAVAPAPASTQSDAQLDNLQQETAVLQNKLRETEYRRQQMDSHIAELSQRLRDADNTKTTVQSDLAIERQWRQNLVREIDQERAKLDALVTVDAELQETKERYAQLMEEHMQLRANYVQQEQSLVDLGSMVAEEKLRGNELEELKRNEAKQTWVDSSSVADCRACGKEFGLLRRKHHCRRCGQIFCDECSSRKAELASSATPVRVCDKCFGVVGQTSLGEPVLLGGWAD